MKHLRMIQKACQTGDLQSLRELETQPDFCLSADEDLFGTRRLVLIALEEKQFEVLRYFFENSAVPKEPDLLPQVLAWLLTKDAPVRMFFEQLRLEQPICLENLQPPALEIIRSYRAERVLSYLADAYYLVDQKNLDFEQLLEHCMIVDHDRFRAVLSRVFGCSDDETQKLRANTALRDALLAERLTTPEEFREFIDIEQQLSQFEPPQPLSTEVLPIIDMVPELAVTAVTAVTAEAPRSRLLPSQPIKPLQTVLPTSKSLVEPKPDTEGANVVETNRITVEVCGMNQFVIQVLDVLVHFKTIDGIYENLLFGCLEDDTFVYIDLHSGTKQTLSETAYFEKVEAILQYESIERQREVLQRQLDALPKTKKPHV